MARLAPLWQQNNSYPAATDRALLGTLWPASGVSGGAVQVVTNTMQVQILVGTAAVALTGANYTALCRWDAIENVTLSAAPPSGQSRIDVIVLQVRDATIDAGSNNDFIFQAIAGTPTTGTPVAPSVPANAMALAQLTVPGGVANLNGVTVVDRRVPLAARDALHSQVSRAAAYTFPSTATPVPFDTIDRDPAAMWTPAQSGWTIPVTGVYQVAHSLTWTAAAAGNFFNVQYVPATPFVASVAPSAGANTPNVGSRSLYLTAGQILKIQVNAGAAYPMLVGGNFNWATLDYLGTG